MIYLLADLAIIVVLFVVVLGTNEHTPKDGGDKDAVRVQIPDSLVQLLPPEHRD